MQALLSVVRINRSPIVMFESCTLSLRLAEGIKIEMGQRVDQFSLTMLDDRWSLTDPVARPHMYALLDTRKGRRPPRFTHLSPTILERASREKIHKLGERCLASVYGDASEENSSRKHHRQGLSRSSRHHQTNRQNPHQSWFYKNRPTV